MQKRKKGRIHWTPELWEKVAKEFATIFVRNSQGGKRPSFAAVMEEAQGTLPAKLQRSYIINSFANCPAQFKVHVDSEIEKLTKPAEPRNGASKINGHAVRELEIALNPKEKIGYAVPPNITMSQGFRDGLIKAGFKFEKIGGVTDMEMLINSGYHIEQGIVTPK